MNTKTNVSVEGSKCRKYVLGIIKIPSAEPVRETNES